MNVPAGMLDRVKDEVALLDRHLEVLRTVMAHQPIGIMRLAELMDLPYHRIRYSLRVLEQMGYIRASPEGAMVMKKADRLLSTLDDQLKEIVERIEEIRRENSHNV
jgi:predicted transcriptional regulator